MTTKCPTCNRVFRPKKLKANETLDEANQRIIAQVKARISIYAEEAHAQINRL